MFERILEKCRIENVLLIAITDNVAQLTSFLFCSLAFKYNPFQIPIHSIRFRICIHGIVCLLHTV